MLKRGLVVASIVGTLLFGPSAIALVATDTNGDVCRGRECPHHHIETFSGGYVFRGTTSPSRAGQVVEFSYKKRGATTWRSFDTPKNHACFVSNGSSAQIDDQHGWKKRFDINGFTCSPTRRFVLRARFPQQGNFGGSAVRVRVRAFYGD
jgi:hypothetical protein